jgi:hypothetical protein
MPSTVVSFVSRFHKDNRRERAKLAYLAGIIDGEGHVKFEKWGTIRLTVGMTSYKIIKWIHTNFGGTLNLDQLTCTGKRFYVWRLNNGLDVLKLMILLYPYLMLKDKPVLKALKVLHKRLSASPKFSSVRGLKI